MQDQVLKKKKSSVKQCETSVRGLCGYENIRTMMPAICIRFTTDAFCTREYDFLYCRSWLYCVCVCVCCTESVLCKYLYFVCNALHTNTQPNCLCCKTLERSVFTFSYIIFFFFCWIQTK